MSIGTNDTHQIMNVSKMEYGYIVSHANYGVADYFPGQNNSLTLTGLYSGRVEIVLEQIDVYKDDAGNCVDYLLISTLDKICGSTPMSFYVNLSSSVNEITLIFKTTTAQSTHKGFWLSYKGIYTF